MLIFKSTLDNIFCNSIIILKIFDIHSYFLTKYVLSMPRENSHERCPKNLYFNLKFNICGLTSLLLIPFLYFSCRYISTLKSGTLLLDIIIFDLRLFIFHSKIVNYQSKISVKESKQALT